MNCICVILSENLEDSAKQCLSLTQCMREISNFRLTILTVYFPFEAVRLAYPEDADWITSASSSYRCLITSGGVNMSRIIPIMTVESSMPHKTSTSFFVKHAGSKAADGKASIRIQTCIASFVYRYLYCDFYSGVYRTFFLSLSLSRSFYRVPKVFMVCL